MASTVFREYDEFSEPWDNYVKRLEQYFILNDIHDDKKVSAILSLMGSKTYSLLQSLVMPAAPEEKDFCEIVSILRTHFNPLPNKITERIKFRDRLQLEHESLQNFCVELKKLAKYCAFTEDTYDENLLEQFLRGIRNKGIQQKLLPQVSDLNFDKALSLSVMMENTTFDSPKLNRRQQCSVKKPTEKNFDTQAPLADIEKLDTDRSHSASFSVSSRESSKAGKEANKIKHCFRCGGTSHTAYYCNFIDDVCYMCGKTGHLRKQCVKVHNYLKAGKLLSKSKDCYRCGGTEHFAFDCDFKDDICYKCGKIGHIRKQCMRVHNHIQCHKRSKSNQRK